MPTTSIDVAEDDDDVRGGVQNALVDRSNGALKEPVAIENGNDGEDKNGTMDDQIFPTCIEDEPEEKKTTEDTDNNDETAAVAAAAFPETTKPTSIKEEEEDEVCPVCLRTNLDDATLDWVYNPLCGHGFCLPCMDQLLIWAPPRSRSNVDDNANGDYYYYLDSENNHNETNINGNNSFAPTTITLGICPVCRTDLSYFDLRYKRTDRCVVPNSDDDQEEEPNELNNNSKNSNSNGGAAGGGTLPSWDAQLNGSIFLEDSLPDLGWGSVHFPPFDAEEGGASSTSSSSSSSSDPNNDNETVNDSNRREDDAYDASHHQHHRRRRRKVPCVNYSNVAWRNAAECPATVWLDESCRYHAPSHTLEGKAVYHHRPLITTTSRHSAREDHTTTMNGNNNKTLEEETTTGNNAWEEEDMPPLSHCTTWRFIMSFSHNFQFITQGILVRTKYSGHDYQLYGIRAGDSTDAVDAPSPVAPFVDGSWLVAPIPIANSGRVSSRDASGRNESDDHGGRRWTSSNGQDYPSNPIAVFSSLCHEQMLTVTRDLLCENETWYQLLQNGSAAGDIYLVERMSVSLRKSKPMLVASWDWDAQPDGPVDIGARLVWHTVVSSGDEPTGSEPVMEWIRQTSPRPFFLPPSSKTDVIPLGGERGSMMRRVTSKHNAVRPKYNSKSVWGNVFVQLYKVGAMSFHFVRWSKNQKGAKESNNKGRDSLADNHNFHDKLEIVNENYRDDNSVGFLYMSFEHASNGRLSQLDDGRPLPSRVKCRNVQFSDNGRTVECHVNWLQDIGLPWQEMTQWKLKMHFDTEFVCILSGSLHGSPIGEKDNWFPMRDFSSNLLYCNAGLYDFWYNDASSGAPKADNTKNDSDEGLPQASAPRSSSDSVSRLRHRLKEQEGASAAVWKLVRTVAQAAKTDRRNHGTPTNPMIYSSERVSGEVFTNRG